MPTYNIDDPFSLLLLKITDRLKEKAPGLLVVKDIGQLETPQQPDIDGAGTVLIGFADFAMNELSNYVQEGEGDVIIKVAKEAYNLVSGITPVAQNQDVLLYGVLTQQVYKALHGWAPGEPFGSMIRRSRSEDNRRRGLMVSVQRYRIALEDYSAKPTQRTAPADLNVSTTIVIPD